MSIILSICSIVIAEDKNIGFLMNQKYVCINIGALVNNKLQPIISREEALKYPIRIKIDKWNKLQTDGPIKNLDYVKKDASVTIYENNKTQIMLNVANNVRYMLLKNLNIKSMPAIIHECIETDKWTIVK